MTAGHKRSRPNRRATRLHLPTTLLLAGISFLGAFSRFTSGSYTPGPWVVRLPARACTQHRRHSTRMAYPDDGHPAGCAAAAAADAAFQRGDYHDVLWDRAGNAHG
ncbi:hypothetical protein DFH09DRAFT_1187166 [Mycena vulgaris]|nr:hypothetical protein DFH09DRAFT_1187166 [Mycena vulgaris]